MDNIYGNASWIIGAPEKRRRESSKMQHYWKLLGVRWTDKIKNRGFRKTERKAEFMEKYQ